jgi:hypothetical protein
VLFIIILAKCCSSSSNKKTQPEVELEERNKNYSFAPDNVKHVEVEVTPSPPPYHPEVEPTPIPTVPIPNYNPPEVAPSGPPPYKIEEEHRQVVDKIIMVVFASISIHAELRMVWEPLVASALAASSIIKTVCDPTNRKHIKHRQRLEAALIEVLPTWVSLDIQLFQLKLNDFLVLYPDYAKKKKEAEKRQRIEEERRREREQQLLQKQMEEEVSVQKPKEGSR